jgi:hypothetical protein
VGDAVVEAEQVGLVGVAVLDLDHHVVEHRHELVGQVVDGLGDEPRTGTAG